MFLDSLPTHEKRLKRSDTFRFSCHKSLSCFNSCCRNKHLPLTPYDVLRLKNALDLNSDDFLSQCTVYDVDPRSGFPVISIKMKEDSERNCPFVKNEGCSVYLHRPTACRLFPLARATGAATGARERKEFYHMLDIPGCLGSGETQILSVGQWIDDQGLQTYIEANDCMVDFVLRSKNALGGPLDGSHLRKVIVACYNLDVFRDFVFATQFLDVFGVDDGLRMKVRDDDEALLELGFVYLRQALIS